MNYLIILCGDKMSYKNLNIKKSYETSGDKNQLLDEFYIPFLSETIEYRRIAGFFSSSSLIVASEGIEGLINNNGKMKLLISPELSEQDYEIIKSTNQISDNLNMFNDIKSNEFPKNDNLEALAWMLKNNRLEIKIVVNKNSGTSIFHQKVGIGFDKEGNQVSFSGSINESANAWINNIEEFKTFKSWESEQMDYLLNDLKKFNSYWNNEKRDIASVYDIPESIKNKIVNISPNNINDLLIMNKYKRQTEAKKNNKMSLFYHQKKAVEMWKNNEYKLLMEMATGTGKTRTAIGCFMELKNKIDKLVVIVATPQNTLSRQWKNDIENELGISFERSIIADGSNYKWKIDLEKVLLDVSGGIYKDAILYTTHSSASSDDFIKIIEMYGDLVNILFICDEVHGIGSEKQKEALLDVYKYRIGLSATPERMYDEEGTSLIREYFGNSSFEFTIREALNTINPITGQPFLNKFYYHPCFVYLNEEELEKYRGYSKKIATIANQDYPDLDLIEKYKIDRANVLKNADEKINMVESIIDKLNNKDRIKDTIIFTTDKQIEPVLTMLGKKGIMRSKITEEESASRIVGIRGNTEREENIDQFRDGKIQVLIGLKCLDEGIDIKNARIAILMASSTNPREYVQRVGRVIRVAKGKEYSEIYDLIVTTMQNDSSNNKILEKEAKRTKLIASNAINYDEVKEVFARNGVDLDVSE